MNHPIRISAVVVMCLVVMANAAVMLHVTNGQAGVLKPVSGEMMNIADSTSVNFGDSIVMGADNQATLSIEKNSRLFLKGPCSVVLSNDNSVIKVQLYDGQVLLDRNPPYEFSSIQIITRGYVFQPLGTVAAVRTSGNSYPSTAVVRGQMKMLSPTGESIIVDNGSYGSIDKNGNLVQGKLSPEAIESLKTWGNISDVTEQPQIAQAAEEKTPASPVNETSQTVSPQTPVQSSVNDVKKPDENPAVSQNTLNDKTSSSNAPEINKEGATASVNAADTSKKTDEAEKQAAAEDKKSSKKDSEKSSGDKPTWEINAGTATVDNEQWTRLAVGVDVPIWKFGVFFDLELFIDNNGKVSDKGWNFGDDWFDALTRKIRYIRFGHEEEPLFIKFGGLSNVTLGYGFLVDRFTNMLHYPDQKLPGLQFYLNKISPIGITLQTFVADFKDFEDDGGVLGARLAFTPFKNSKIPIVNGFTFGGTYAVDLNQYAPARNWDIQMSRSMRTYNYLRHLNVPYQEAIDSSIAFTEHDPRVDSVKYTEEMNASEADDQFGLFGGDVSVPLISSKLINLDLYGQAGIREDLDNGWGFGAPGLYLKVWKIWAGVEYRHVEGRFQPGYFGTYYLDERLQREPEIVTKSQTLDSYANDKLNGVFGKLGFNIADVLILDGSYQYMIGDNDDNKDQRFEAICSIGDLIVKRIPRLTKAEAYYQKTDIGITDVGYDPVTGKYEKDSFFDKTPHMYWGYRLGIGIAEGASLIFDSRYGYKRDSNDPYKMKPDNNISILTAISF